MLPWENNKDDLNAEQSFAVLPRGLKEMLDAGANPTRFRLLACKCMHDVMLEGDSPDEQIVTLLGLARNHAYGNGTLNDLASGKKILDAMYAPNQMGSMLESYRRGELSTMDAIRQSRRIEALHGVRACLLNTPVGAICAVLEGLKRHRLVVCELRASLIISNLGTDWLQTSIAPFAVQWDHAQINRLPYALQQPVRLAEEKSLRIFAYACACAAANKMTKLSDDFARSIRSAYDSAMGWRGSSDMKHSHDAASEALERWYEVNDGTIGSDFALDWNLFEKDMHALQAFVACSCPIAIDAAVMTALDVSCYLRNTMFAEWSECLYRDVRNFVTVQRKNWRSCFWDVLLRFGHGETGMSRLPSSVAGGGPIAGSGA